MRTVPNRASGARCVSIILYQSLHVILTYFFLVVIQGEAEARQEEAELTTPPNGYIYPMEAMIDEVMATFQRVGGLPAVIQFVARFSESAEAAPIRDIMNSVYHFLIGLTAQ